MFRKFPVLQMMQILIKMIRSWHIPEAEGEWNAGGPEALIS
jgi:hypothetical protein